MDPSSFSRPNYASLRYFAGRYKIYLLAILALTLVSSVLESFSILAFFPVFSSLLGNSTDEAGGILGFITSVTNLVPVSNPIVAASVLLVGIFLVKTVLTLAREFTTAYVGARSSTMSGVK